MKAQKLEQVSMSEVMEGFMLGLHRTGIIDFKTPSITVELPESEYINLVNHYNSSGDIRTFPGTPDAETPNLSYQWVNTRVLFKKQG